jgi:hypothetical protein
MGFFVPLIYTSNQELIDDQLRHASEVVGAQTSQLRNVASKHTAQATEITKQYMGDYTAKAQSMLRGNKKPVAESDFPTAPKSNFKREEEVDMPAMPTVPEKEPLIA